MINDAISGGGMYSNAQVHVGNSAANAAAEEARQKEVLDEQSKALSKALDADTVEISDAAKALSEAASATSGSAQPSPAAAAESAVAETNAAAAAATENLDGPDDVNTTKTAEQEKYATSESRQDEGARLDAYLNDLREKYGEEEAMSRFTEYMKSEGYEVAEREMPTATGGSTNERLYGLKSSVSSFSERMRGRLGAPDPKAMEILRRQGGGDYTQSSAITSDNVNNSFIMSSRLNTTVKGGNATHSGETWVQFDALANTRHEAVLDSWKQRNTDKLSEEAGFNVLDYVNNFTSTTKTWGKAFSAESVSADLGGIMNRILGDAGIKLESGQNITILADPGQGGGAGLNINTNFGDAATRDRIQSAFDQAVRKDPGILEAFQVESSRVGQADLGQLDGSFNNGVQSNSYLQQRQFLFSADEPSVVVMGSGLDYKSKGYVFTKKVSDSFDASADLIDVKASADTYGGMQDYEKFKNKITSQINANN